jgi:hypothetical protein
MCNTEYILYQLDKTGYQGHQFGVMNVLHERPLARTSPCPFSRVLAEELGVSPQAVYAASSQMERDGGLDAEAWKDGVSKIYCINWQRPLQPVDVFDAIRALMTPSAKPRKKIGFMVKEKRATYGNLGTKHKRKIS